MWDKDFEKAKIIEQKSKIDIDWEGKVTSEDIACQVCRI